MNNEHNTLRVYFTYENSARTKSLRNVTEEAPLWKAVIIPVTATQRFKIIIAGDIKPGSNTGIFVDNIYYWTSDCYVKKAMTTATVVPSGSTSPSLSWSHSATTASLNCLFVAVDTEGSPAVIRDEPAPTDVNPEQSAPSATLLIVVATAVVAIVVVVAVLSVYVMKRKCSRRPAENADEHSEGAPLRHQFAPSRPWIPSLHSVHNYSDIEDVNLSENTGEHRNPRVASDGYLEPHPLMKSAATCAQVNTTTASGDTGNSDPGEASNYTHLNPRDEAAAGDHYTPLRLLGQGGNSSDYTQLGPREENPVAGSDGAYTALMPVGLSGDREVSGSGGEGNEECQDDYIAMGPARRHNPVYENTVDTDGSPAVDRDELAPSAVDSEQSAPSATLLIVVATAVVAIVVIVAVLSVYAMKRKRSRRPAENADEHSEGAPLRHQFAPSRPGIPSLHSVHNCSDIEDVNVSENTGGHRNPRVASDGYLEPHPRMNSASTRAQPNTTTASGDTGNTDPGEASNYTHLNPRDEPAAGDHYTPLRLLGQGGNSSDYTRLGPRDANPVAGRDGAYTALMPVGLSEGNDEYQDDYIAMGPVRRHNPVYENSA
ncbi:hypothetical protein BaRGS_00036488 [Batillaria attramentaria]|uniref:MAM domain-containing protein n=1 Tax=Batillaria attramentaria TaxID=370345 RepID=A0ABD0JBF7_9CAEN